jgi:hypothetical protein
VVKSGADYVTSFESFKDFTDAISCTLKTFFAQCYRSDPDLNNLVGRDPNPDSE